MSRDAADARRSVALFCSTPDRMYDLVTIGHAARDEFAGDPEWRIGGTAVYAAAAAARFGARAALVTRVGPHERERLVGRCARLGMTLHAPGTAVAGTSAFRFASGKP